MDDPLHLVIQPASEADIEVGKVLDAEYRTSVEEEIEIIEDEVNSSKFVHVFDEPAPNVGIIKVHQVPSISDNSMSSAPPGFSTKRKNYLIRFLYFRSMR